MRCSSNKILVVLLMVVVVGLVRLLSAPAAAETDLGRLPDTVDIVTVRALQSRGDVVLIDVREPEEYRAGHIPGITLIPMGQVPSQLAEIPKDKTVILTCRSGNRSSQVADLLRQQGYTAVHNMKGGLQAWQAAGYPVEK